MWPRVRELFKNGRLREKHDGDDKSLSDKSSISSIDGLLSSKVLCSNRVSQMTKTYNDIEAVTRLLEEKERDLELTARIGKELLQHNNKLESSVVTLEAELKNAQEKITQLTHEVVKKQELIQVLTNDVEQLDSIGNGSGEDTYDSLSGVSMDFMQKRIKNLEDENKTLKSEFLRISLETDDCEEREKRLVQDITMQLANSNLNYDSAAEELERYREENRQQHEQMMNLTSKLTEADELIKKYQLENEELQSLVQLTKDTQNTLANELVESKERYNEVLELLRDTQEQLRRQRKKGMPLGRGVGGSLYPSLYSNNNFGQPDSLQNELESSLYSELSLDSGIVTGMEKNIPPFKNAFETVKCASKSMSSAKSKFGGQSDISSLPLSENSAQLTSSLTLSTSLSLTSTHQSRMSVYPATSGTGLPSRYSSLSYGYVSYDGNSDTESIAPSEEGYPAQPQPGVPGIPGAADLEEALKRLTPAEVSARRAQLQYDNTLTNTDSIYEQAGGTRSPPLPFGCRTPDSLMSASITQKSSLQISAQTQQRNVVSYPHLGGAAGTWWRIPPEKLQIVKPIEGSQTLLHWSQLAKPTFNGLLDDRTGVKIRGGRALEDMLGMETYTLSDLEEDDEYTHPGKMYENSSCIYTFTNSTVMHPDDVASVTGSIQGSRMSSVCPSECGSVAQTPRILSRRNSCSTFSTTLGLAKMLNERGIKAATPSCLNSPTRNESFSPTATPCNSPDGSPGSSRCASPAPSPFGAMVGSLPLGGLLSSGAELLRRSVFGDPIPPPSPISRKPKRAAPNKRVLSRIDKKALSSIRIVEKIENIGLESIIGSSTNSSICDDESDSINDHAIFTRHGLAHTSSPMSYQKRLTTMSLSDASEYSEKTSSGISSDTSSIDQSKIDRLVKKPPIVPSSQRNNEKLETPPTPTRAPSASRERTPASLGVPGRPGTGQLNRRLEQLAARHNTRRQSGTPRPDLGTVEGPSRYKNGTVVSKEPTPEPVQQSTLGTISSLLFGRKGGLL